MKQIIAMGGGGFSMEPENPLLDTYILQQSGKDRPKVCFVPTASGDAEGYIERFYTAFKQHDCEASHLSLLHPTIANPEPFLLAQDVIYVGGGNTKNLLALWRAWGLDTAMRKAWEQGVVLAGVSAGSICWFEQGITDSIPGALTALPCLGFLPGSNAPHYDGEVDRRPSYHRLMGAGLMIDGLAADDGAALHYVGPELRAVISSRPAARAYSVRRTPAGVVEEALSTRFLGGAL